MPNLIFGHTGAEAVRSRFRQFNITLPAVQMGGATVAGRIAQTGVAPLLGSSPQKVQPVQVAAALFRAASNSPADVAHQQAMHELYDSMFQQLIAAIEHGFNLYRQSAGLVDIVINGPHASGGRLQGPNLDKLIMTAPSVSTWSGPKVIMRDAVAKGLHQQWSKLADSVRVPGLLWYPAFVAHPGLMAPPIPNVPTPFKALTHDPGATSPTALKGAMRSWLHHHFNYSDESFESIALGFDSALQVWKGVQMVTQVMGTGPVPNFAPPFSPAAPVARGKVLAGSHISS